MFCGSTDEEGEMMNKQTIKALALANGFKLKTQPDGTENLNPYVYDFAAALLAHAVECIHLDEYDAGFLNEFGGGNVGWWQDYIRSELGMAYDFYQSQIDEYAAKVRKGGEQ